MNQQQEEQFKRKLERIREESGKVLPAKFFKGLRIVPQTLLKHNLIIKIKKGCYQVTMSNDFSIDNFIESQKIVHVENCRKGKERSHWKVRNPMWWRKFKEKSKT